MAGSDLRTIAVSPDGVIWAADFYGKISRMYKGEWFTLPTKPIPEINVMLPLDTGELWIGTQGGRVAIFENYDWQGPPRVVPMEKGGTAVYDLAISPQGHLWAATWDGLFELWGDDWLMIPKPVPNDALYSPKSLYFDRQGGLWVGARHSFNYYQNGVWLGPSDGLPDLVNIEDIEEDGSGNLWFGGVSGAIVFDGEDWIKVFPPGADQDGFAIVESLAVDAEGQIWLISNLGTFFYQDEIWQPAITDVGSPDISIRSVEVDPWGALWFVSSEGVLCYLP